MGNAYDDIPGWIKSVTHTEDFEDDMEYSDRRASALDQLNFLKGSYMGFTLRVEQLEKQLAEADEKFDLARDYQRQLDIQTLEGLLGGIWAADDRLTNIKEGIRRAIAALKQEG